MNRTADYLLGRVGWIFGLSTLFGLLASAGYALFRLS